MHTPAPPFAHTNGSRQAKIALVAEGWGANEDMLKSPLVGSSGHELARMLHEANLCPAPPHYPSNLGMKHFWSQQPNLFLTNVFAFRPPNNKLDALCVKKAEAEELALGSQELLANFRLHCTNIPEAKYPYIPMSMGKYVRPEYLPEIWRLKQELETVQPNLVIALGATATWALLRSTKITDIRGAVAQSTLCPTLKILPTFHPAAVMRNWPYRPICIADFIKAAREAQTPMIVRPERWVLVNPTIEEVENWTAQQLANPPILMGSDIETKRGQIDMVSFAPDHQHAIVIPFLDEMRPGWNYWPTMDHELRAWECIARIMASDIPKLYQNGLYDLQYKSRMGLRCNACREDTMLQHHTMYPEMKKGLGFLGSIYTSEQSWKLLRLKGQEENKREE